MEVPSHGSAATGLARTVFISILLVFIGVRIRDLEFTLWNDEVFSVRTARLGWDMILDRIAYDRTHPPLFYLILKGWMAVGGESLGWLRVLPVSMALLTVVPFIALCRELRLAASEVNLAFFLLAPNWFLVWHAADLRMYTLLLLLTTTSLWLFLRARRSGAAGSRALWALTLVNICLVYTHYYGWLVVGVEVAYALFKESRQLPRFIVAALIVTACSIPWVLAILYAAPSPGHMESYLGWIERPDLKSVPWLYASLNGMFMSEWRIVRWTAVAGLLLFGYPIIVWAMQVTARWWKGTEHERDGIFWFLVLGAAGPPVIAFAASYLLNTSVWTHRSLIITAVPYLLLVALAVSNVSPHWLRVVTMSLIVIWAGLAGLQGMARGKISWGHLVQEMRRVEPLDTTERRLIAVSSFAQTPLEYYLEQANDRRFTIERVSESKLSEWAAGIEEASDKILWVAYANFAEKWQEELPEGIFSKRGYAISERFDSGTKGHSVVLFRACWQTCTSGDGEKSAALP